MPTLTPQHSMTRQSIRKKIRSARQALSPEEQTMFALMLTQQVVRLNKVATANNIAIYLSNDGELDTRSFIQWCWQNQINVYLPIIHPFAKGHLLFIQYQQNSKMKLNKYGIKEPVLDIRNIIQVKDLDIMFTPLVAFDSTGSRIGMGGGYYDRTLAHWHKNNLLNIENKMDVIGLANDCQEVETIPAEKWDIPLPTIVTPTRIIENS